MKRREFLKATGRLSTQAFLGMTLIDALTVKRAAAATGLPLAQLTSAIDPKHAQILVPTSSAYGQYNIAFNKRNLLQPQVRVVANAPEAIQSAIVWATANQIPFAIRCGGHSYEGFSQSNQLVIDVRGLSQLQVSDDKSTVTVGSGLALGQVYKALAPLKLAIPAGSCFPVGVSGHTLGGGFGLLARKFGLAADSVESAQVIDAQARLVTASSHENQDLYWSLRGGGNGNFGVVTNFTFKTSPVYQVAVFGLSWTGTVDQVARLAPTWQGWIQELPDDVTATIHFGKAPGGKILFRISGQSVGSATDLQKELDRLQHASTAAQVKSLKMMKFLDAAAHFNGPDMGYESVYMKAKSDYVTEPMSDLGIRTLLQGLLDSPTTISVMADTYGGAINRIARDTTAFVHRGTTLYSLQYYMEWQNRAQSTANIESLRSLYAKMRPFVSGESYVNYCDLDLADYAKAYWAENLPRLISVKQQWDPKNLFRHPQSVPLG